MQVWPFPPREELIEVLSWQTTVIRAKSAEQRIAMRTAPRREFNLLHTLTEIEYSAARAMVRGNDRFHVPDWDQAVDIGPVNAGSNVVVAHDELPYVDFYQGAALLWAAVDVYEVVEIELVGSDYQITSVVGNYGRALLMPVLGAYLPGGISISRRAAILHEISASFVVYENTDLGASAKEQYRGHDVLTDCPVIAGGSFSEGLSWEYSVYDNLSSIPEYLRRRSLPDLVYQMRWHVFTAADKYNLRRWIHSRRGKQKVFWLSSVAHDFTLATAIGASSTVITVFKLPGIDDLGRDQAFDIEIKTAAGVHYYRQVTSATPGSPVGGQSTISLTISSSLGSSVSLAQIERISFLRCTRFESDRIEFSHRASSGTVVQVPCIEVPIPA